MSYGSEARACSIRTSLNTCYTPGPINVVVLGLNRASAMIEMVGWIVRRVARFERWFL